MEKGQHDFFELPEPAVDTQLSSLAAELQETQDATEKIYLNREELEPILKELTGHDPRITSYHLLDNGELSVSVQNTDFIYTAYRLSEEPTIYFELA